jgi:hypothetical protein
VVGVQVTIGLILVLVGAFLSIIGTLGAIGAGLQLRLLPGRKVLPLGDLRKARAGGRVVVRGTVAPGPGGTLRAPLSGQECVWYLASQSATDGTTRDTVESFAASPFALVDAAGAQVLVGPRCPALEQIAPSWRAERTDGHPWFERAPNSAGAVEVLEFVLTGGEDLLAAGDLANPAGAAALTGDVALSAGGDAAALGDPATRTWRRDLALAVAGFLLIAGGAAILSVSDQRPHKLVGAAPHEMTTRGLVSPGDGRPRVPSR